MRSDPIRSDPNRVATAPVPVPIPVRAPAGTGLLVWGFPTLLLTADDDIELGFGQWLIANSNTFDCSSSSGTTTSWLGQAPYGPFQAAVSRLLGQQAALPLSHCASRTDWLAFAENLRACLHLLHRASYCARCCFSLCYCIACCRYHSVGQSRRLPWVNADYCGTYNNLYIPVWVGFPSGVHLVKCQPSL